MENKKGKYTRQNDWINKNRERQTVIFPTGTKERIKAKTNESINGYINRLVFDDLNGDKKKR